MIKRTSKPSINETFRKPQAQAKPRPPQFENDEAEDEAEATPNSKKGSLEERFNAIASATGFANAENIPPGKYEAIVSEGVYQAPDAKGQSVRLRFDLCDPDYKDQNQIAQWYRILDADNEPFVGGIKALAFQFAKLGYELTLSGIEEDLAKITEDKPGVLVKVSYRDYQGAQYPKVNIEGLCDNDVVQEYKDSVPY